MRTSTNLILYLIRILKNSNKTMASNFCTFSFLLITMIISTLLLIYVRPLITNTVVCGMHQSYQKCGCPNFCNNERKIVMFNHKNKENECSPPCSTGCYCDSGYLFQYDPRLGLAFERNSTIESETILQKFHCIRRHDCYNPTGIYVGKQRYHSKKERKQPNF